MIKKFSDRSTFYCFTPTASLITFLIEFILAFYVIMRYKLNEFSRIAVLILIFLGLFQLSEYMMCTTDQTAIWGKLGVASITMLPALGVHLITYLTKKSTFLVTFGYLLVGLTFFMVFFQLPTGNFRCVDTFVTLLYGSPYDLTYTAYYLGFLLIGLYLLFQSLLREKKYAHEKKWMIVGYLSFILPTTILYALSLVVDYAIPSVMCGFALLFAIILAFKIIPGYNDKKEK